MEIDWITAKQTAEKWGISDRRVQYLCSNGQITGVVKMGLGWLIPKNASKPKDGRRKKESKPKETKK